MTANDHHDAASLTIGDLFAYLVADEQAANARKHYCQVVGEHFSNVAAWLALDAWLGAGDVVDTSSEPAAPEPSRARSFVAAGLVADISAELIAGARVLFASDNDYSASALVRQLIECEYLLRASLSSSGRQNDG